MRISDWSSDVCSSDLDSHTGTQGAFGALAWGIGSSEAEHALATGTLRVRKPATMRVTVTGRLADGVGAKDLALHIIALVGSDGAQGHAVEFAGAGVAALDIEPRQTPCNRATDISAFCAIKHGRAAGREGGCEAGESQVD